MAKQYADHQSAEYIALHDGETLPVTAKLQAPDGNASDFSMATVGAHFTILSAALAVKTTTTKPAGATGLLVQNTGTAGVRFTLDGTDPTATSGFLIPASLMPTLIPCPGTAIEWIRSADGAQLDGQWVK